MSPRTTEGVTALSAAKLAEVGFIIQGGNNNDCNYHYENYV
ncbi:hypothetical protein [Paenibacillus sp. OK060]|nr:hypothetical protein [Paenibacillus sp. OK060]